MNKDFTLFYKNDKYKFSIQPNLTYDFFLIYFPQKNSSDCYIKINDKDVDAQSVFDYCSNIFDNELNQNTFDEVLFDSKIPHRSTYVSPESPWRLTFNVVFN